MVTPARRRWTSQILRSSCPGMHGRISKCRGECAKRRARVEWQENGAAHIVHADESHLAYILKSVLLAALSQTKMGSEIVLDVSRHGALLISYRREGARVVSIAHYLDEVSPRPDENIL